MSRKDGFSTDFIFADPIVFTSMQLRTLGIIISLEIDFKNSPLNRNGYRYLLSHAFMKIKECKKLKSQGITSIFWQKDPFLYTEHTINTKLTVHKIDKYWLGNGICEGTPQPVIKGKHRGFSFVETSSLV